jgi:hypothetical protein
MKFIKKVNYTLLESPKVNYPSGIYLVNKKSEILPNLIDHYGVMFVGATLKSIGYSDAKPIVFHLTDSGFQKHYLEGFGVPQVLGKVNSNDLLQTIWRLKISFFNPNYDLISNNCEQFARFVTEGYKQSIQLQTVTVVGLVAGFFGLILFANNNDS